MTMLKTGILKLQAKEGHALQIRRVIVLQMGQHRIELLQAIKRLQVIEHLQVIIERLHRRNRLQPIERQRVHQQLIDLPRLDRTHLTGPPRPDRWGHHLVLPVQVVLQVQVVLLVQAEVVQAEVVVVEAEVVVVDDINFESCFNEKRRPFHLKWPPFLKLLYTSNQWAYHNQWAYQRHSYL